MPNKNLTNLESNHLANVVGGTCQWPYFIASVITLVLGCFSIYMGGKYYRKKDDPVEDIIQRIGGKDVAIKDIASATVFTGRGPRRICPTSDVPISGGHT